MPLLPPVISATFPSSLPACFCIRFRLYGAHFLLCNTAGGLVETTALITALANPFSHAGRRSGRHGADRALTGRSKGSAFQCHDHSGRFVTTRKPCPFRLARHKPQRSDTLKSFCPSRSARLEQRWPRTGPHAHSARARVRNVHSLRSVPVELRAAPPRH